VIFMVEEVELEHRRTATEAIWLLPEFSLPRERVYRVIA
jgi:hypothetical protein